MSITCVCGKSVFTLKRQAEKSFHKEGHDIISCTNEHDNTPFGLFFKTFMVLHLVEHMKSDRSSCVKNEKKDSLREKFIGLPFKKFHKATFRQLAAHFLKAVY